jgi:4-hydroxybenzoate polyprenyltransferase
VLARVSAFAVFCALSGVVYLVNDIVDRDSDRLHPLKRTADRVGRVPVPVAAGRRGVGAARLAGASSIGPLCGVGGVYLALQILYSFAFKHMVILDVLTIAIGFVLRAVGGALRCVWKSATGCWSARSCSRCSWRWQSGVMKSCCWPAGR